MPSKTKTDPTVAAKYPVTPTQEQPPTPLSGEIRHEDEESSSRSLEDAIRREGEESSSSLDDEMRHDDDESSSRSLEDRLPKEDPAIENPNIAPQVPMENLMELDASPQIHQDAVEQDERLQVSFEGGITRHEQQLSSESRCIQVESQIASGSRKEDPQAASGSRISQHESPIASGSSSVYDPRIPSTSGISQHKSPTASGSSSVYDPQIPSTSGISQHESPIASGSSRVYDPQIPSTSGKKPDGTQQQTRVESPMETDDESSGTSEDPLFEAVVQREYRMPPAPFSARWIGGQWLFYCQKRYGRLGQAGCSTWAEGNCPSYADPKEVTSYYSTLMRYKEHKINETEDIPDSSDSSAELEFKKKLRESKLQANQGTAEKAVEEPPATTESSDDSDIEIRRPKHIKHAKPQGKKGKKPEETQLGSMLADTKSNQPSSSLFGTPPETRDSFLGSFLSDTKSNQPLPDFMVSRDDSSPSPPVVIEEEVPDYRKTRAGRLLTSESYVNSRKIRQLEMDQIKLAIERSLRENWAPLEGIAAQMGIAKPRPQRRDPPPPPTSENVPWRPVLQDQPSTSRSVQNIMWHRQHVGDIRRHQPVQTASRYQHVQRLVSSGQDLQSQQPIQDPRLQQPRRDPRLQHPELVPLSYQPMQNPQVQQQQQQRGDPIFQEYSARDLRIRRPGPDPQSPKKPRHDPAVHFHPSEDPRLHQYPVQDLRIARQDSTLHQQPGYDPRSRQEPGYDPQERQQTGQDLRLHQEQPRQFPRVYMELDHERHQPGHDPRLHRMKLEKVRQPRQEQPAHVPRVYQELGHDPRLHQVQPGQATRIYQELGQTSFHQAQPGQVPRVYQEQGHDLRLHQGQIGQDPQLHQQRPEQTRIYQELGHDPRLHHQNPEHDPHSVQDLETPRSPEESSASSQQPDDQNEPKVVPYLQLNELLQRFEEYNHIVDYAGIPRPRQTLYQPIAQRPPLQHQRYRPVLQQVRQPPSAAAGSEQQLLDQMGQQLHESVVAQSESVAQQGSVEGSPVRTMLGSPLKGSPRRQSPRRGGSQVGSPRGKGYKRKQPNKSSEDES